MKNRINTYFAILCITIVGSAATLIITHIAYAQSYVVLVSTSEAQYSALQQSLLHPTN